MTGFPINPPREPLVDSNGYVVPAWYKYFLAIQKLIGGPVSPFDDSTLLASHTLPPPPPVVPSDDFLHPYFQSPRIDDPLIPPAIPNAPSDDLLAPNLGQYIASLSGAASYTDEMARDAIGAAIVAGTGISVSVNDGADTITITNTGGSGGGGTSAWVELDYYDATASGASSGRTVNVTAYQEVMVIFDLVTLTAAGWRVIQVSTDGGSTWKTAGTDYSTIASSGGVSTDDAIYSHTTSTTAARSSTVMISQLQSTRLPKTAFCPVRTNQVHINTASVITDIRCIGWTAVPAVTNMTGGKIAVYGR